MSVKLHSLHIGVGALHTFLPCLIRFTWNSYILSGGTISSSRSWALSLFVSSGINPILRVTRCTCVSTGNAFLSKSKLSITAADFGPTPGSCRSHFLA